MTTSSDKYEYLVDRNEIAYLFGVGPTAVSNYVARFTTTHKEFPKAVITRSFGRFRLWDVADIVEWHTETFPFRDLDVGDSTNLDGVLKVIKTFRKSK